MADQEERTEETPALDTDEGDEVEAHKHRMNDEPSDDDDTPDVEGHKHR